MEFVRAITDYFRQSLLDMERLCPNDIQILRALNNSSGEAKRELLKSGQVVVSRKCWERGFLKVGEAASVFGIVNKNGARPAGPGKSIEVALFPRVDLLQPTECEFPEGKSLTISPLVVFVKLGRDGGLTPSDKAPWIPRTWLSPNNGRDVLIGDLAAYDDYLADTSYESAVHDWGTLVQFTEGLVKAVTGGSILDPLVEGYASSSRALVLVEPWISPATANHVAVLDRIIEGEEAGPCYQQFVASGDQVIRPMVVGEEWSEGSYRHLGHMSGELPLSPNQRNVMHHLLADFPEGSLLAVNGPPGTGKTMLATSIVAQLWVNAALEESEPPVIVATSDTSQAVRAFRGYFSGIDENSIDHTLRGRWLPGIESYALYGDPNGGSENSPEFPCHGPLGEGFMSGLRSQSYLNEARNAFLERASLWAKEELKDAASAKVKLHESLIETIVQMTHGISTYETYVGLRDELEEGYGSEDALDDEIRLTREMLDECDRKLGELRVKHEEFAELQRDRVSWSQQMDWIPGVGYLYKRSNAQFLKQGGIELKDSRDRSVEVYFQQTADSLGKQQQELEDALNQVTVLKQNYIYVRKTLRVWCKAANPGHQNNTDLSLSQVHEICDRVLRFRAFKLATHYWEARWLEDAAASIGENQKGKKSPAQLQSMWQRFAKLMPCFVSPVHLLPSFFTAYKRRRGTWQSLPLFDFVDYLMVDGGDRLLPEQSAAAFLLSKRALVMGDSRQPEPVWRVPPGLDRANLTRFGLLESPSNSHEFWQQSGLQASTGNLLRVAQRQSPYRQIDGMESGLYLTEHHHCHPGIIDYCNELTYQGVLEAQFNNNEKSVACWPQMGLVHVDGKSDVKSGRRTNKQEAEAIAQWIVENRIKIEDFARAKLGQDVMLSSDGLIQKAVAVVTPFVRQASLIKSALVQQDLPELTVGTVDRLQGETRMLLLFSTVYGEGDQALRKLYDNGYKLLNATVLGARHHFIVFGHRNVFGAGDPASPSGKLRACLEEIATHGTGEFA